MPNGGRQDKQPAGLDGHGRNDTPEGRDLGPPAKRDLNRDAPDAVVPTSEPKVALQRLPLAGAILTAPIAR
jgi:hypothetical protein